MPKKGQYDTSSMDTAINEVKNNKLGLRAAAKNPGHKETCGPSPILTLKEEQQLVKWIEELANRGFPRKKEDILNSVQQFLIENPQPNPFNNNRPGDCWFKAFLRRNPTIVQRTSEAVSNASACVCEKDIRKWFREIQDYLPIKNINMNNPSRIFNVDETGFQICPSTGKVFAGKGMTAPPMIIYPYKRIPEKIAVTVNPNWGIGRSDNGWMTSDTFYDYIKNMFYPYLVENNIQLPLVLFLDEQVRLNI
ncbi:uncharacterized protein LOC126738432 [Anthonomus grandis grandis]|uniref:uncharacterized protein LOC126738432 n=1 Tax=Anthonomus grandis grandis TaxID=2921223 RepID=UPI002165F02A|nr:uncharacterized protein LOC126738432 [Anthonomus grandis grandis]